MNTEDQNQVTMPDSEGRELTLQEHVRQSTMAHMTWHELDHAGYLIGEVGFDGQYVRDHMEDVIQEMLLTRGRMLRGGSGQ